MEDDPLTAQPETPAADAPEAPVASVSVVAGRVAAPPRLPDADERRLIEGLQQGDPEALGDLYARHGEALLRLVLEPRVRDREAARDLLHETFAAASQAGARFRWGGRGIFPWLKGIAVNLSRRFHRDRARGPGAPVPLEAVLPWLAGEDAGPLDQLARAERLEAVRRRIAGVLDDLPERQRRVLVLRLIEGRGRAEAAAALGVQLGNLDVLLYRAVRRFRDLYRARTRREEGPDERS